jgi:hypothetical protein
MVSLRLLMGSTQAFDEMVANCKREAPVRRDRRPGLERKRCRGMSGPSVQFSLIVQVVWRPCRGRILIQPPRIASLFKLLDSVVSYRKSLLFIQPFF